MFRSGTNLCVADAPPKPLIGRANLAQGAAKCNRARRALWTTGTRIMGFSFFGGGSNDEPPTSSDATLRDERARQSEMITQVRAYWEGLRKGDTLPARDQIDPRGIQGALDGAFVLERIAPGVGRLRIAGMGLVDLMGMEVRGMPLSALFEPSGRNRLAMGLEQVFARPALLEATLYSENGIGRPDLNARLILLPLRGDGARPDMALGCLAIAGSYGRRPRRLMIQTQQILPLDAARPDLRPALRRIEGALAEPKVRFEVTPTKSSRSYLRLVKLDKV